MRQEYYGSKLHRFAKSEGYCCLRGMIADTQDRGLSELAREWKVAKNTVHSWRARYADDAIDCRLLRLRSGQSFLGPPCRDLGIDGQDERRALS